MMVTPPCLAVVLGSLVAKATTTTLAPGRSPGDGDARWDRVVLIVAAVAVVVIVREIVAWCIHHLPRRSGPPDDIPPGAS